MSTPDSHRPASQPGGHPEPPNGTWWTIRLWEIQWVRDVLVLAAIFGLFYLGYALRTVTVPMLLALLLAYLCEPLVRRFDRSKHVSREGAVMGLIFGSLGLVVVPLTLALGFAMVQGVGYAAGLARNTTALVTSVHGPHEIARQEAYVNLPSESWRRLSRQLRELKASTMQPEGASKPGAEGSPAEAGEPVAVPPPPDPAATKIEEKGPVIDPVLKDVDAAVVDAQVREIDPAEAQRLRAERATLLRKRPSNPLVLLDYAIGWLQENASALASTAGRRALGGGAQAVSFAIGTVSRIGMTIFFVFLTAFFFYYFSTGYARVIAFFQSLIPDRNRESTLRLVHQMDAVIAGFVRGRLTICAILAVVMTIAYWLIGVPTPLILGPIVGLLFLVPFVHVLGAPVAMLLMWLEPAGVPYGGAWWWIVFMPIGVYIFAQLLDDYILTPAIAGKATNMDSPSILFASIAGGVLAGVYGLLVAIPVAACLKILIREVYWPRVRAWAKGKACDPLPLGGGPPTA